MQESLDKFKAAPQSVKLAVMGLCAGWALHYIFFFGYYGSEFDQRIILLQLGLGSICLFVAAIKAWARAMCIFFNIGFIAFYGVFGLFIFAPREEMVKLGLAALITVAFGYATFYLLVKNTAAYFKLHNPKAIPEPQADPAEGAPTDVPPIFQPDRIKTPQTKKNKQRKRKKAAAKRN